MHLFHCAELNNGLAELPAEEAHHAMNVLRLQAGSVIGLLDGKGTYAEARITEASKRKCTVRILRKETQRPERKARIHLAVAPTKQMDRFEWFLEKATEIGVDRITPVVTHRTERTRLRMDRLEKVLVGAMKQSQRRWLPTLDELTSLKELASLRTPSSGEERSVVQKFFGWCEGDHADFTKVYDPQQDALMLIGPEGDFTPEEAETLIASGFRAVGLGTARLRTETAAMAACTWMSFAQH